MSEQRAPSVGTPQGPVGWLLSLAGRVMGLVLGALLLRVALELLGLYFWWPQEGTRHAYRLVSRELAELKQQLQLCSSVPQITALFEHNYMKFLHTRSWLGSLYIQGTFNHPLQTELTNISFTLKFAFTSFILRLVSLLFALPLFLLCAGVGLVEGYVQSDLRHFGAGILATKRLHRLSVLIEQLGYYSILMYLAFPIYEEQTNAIHVLFSASIVAVNSLVAGLNARQQF